MPRLYRLAPALSGSLSSALDELQVPANARLNSPISVLTADVLSQAECRTRAAARQEKPQRGEDRLSTQVANPPGRVQQPRSRFGHPSRGRRRRRGLDIAGSNAHVSK